MCSKSPGTGPLSFAMLTSACFANYPARFRLNGTSSIRRLLRQRPGGHPISHKECRRREEVLASKAGWPAFFLPVLHSILGDMSPGSKAATCRRTPNAPLVRSPPRVQRRREHRNLRRHQPPLRTRPRRSLHRPSPGRPLIATQPNRARARNKITACASRASCHGNALHGRSDPEF